MKILDLLYPTKALVTTEQNCSIPLDFDVIVKEGKTFEWVKNISVIGSAQFPWKARIEGPVTVMTGFHTFKIHCTYDPSITTSASDIDIKVIIPVEWLREKDYTDIRINYGKCMTLDEYAQHTEQGEYAKKEVEETEVVARKIPKIEEIDIQKLKSDLEILINCLSKMEG